MLLASACIFTSLRSEKVILGLILINAIFMSFVFMAARDAIFVNGCSVGARVFLT